jgi:hypothetical protein
MPGHEYPADAGSVATKPGGGVAGAMLRQLTVSRTYVAPAARVRANAAAAWLPPKSAGSATAVASGAVPEVEYVRVRPAAWRAAATATDDDTAASRRVATTAVRFRGMPLTGRKLAAIRVD